MGHPTYHDPHLHPHHDPKTHRYLHLVPPLALAGLYLLVNFVYRLVPRSLDGVRGVLQVSVIAAAVAMWPLLVPRAAKARLLAASVATLAAALWLVPVWAGHGCWSPDLASLFLMFVSGLGASVSAVWLLPPGLNRLAPRWSSIIAAALIMALIGTFIWVWPRGTNLALSMAHAPKSAGSDPAPRVVWSLTRWSDVLRRLAPSMVRQTEPQPLVTSVGPGRVLVMNSAAQGDIWDVTKGSLLGTVSPQPPAGLYRPTAASAWRRIAVAGDLCAFESGNWTSVVSLATGKAVVDLEAVPVGSLVLAPDGPTALEGQTLTRYDAQGRPLWTIALTPPVSQPDPTGSAPLAYGPDYADGPVRLAPVAEGYACLLSDSLTVIAEGGRVVSRYGFGQSLILRTMTVSPAGRVVYVAAFTADGHPVILALSSNGRFWRKDLKLGTNSFDWLALPSGLVLSYSWSEDAAGNSPPAPDVASERRDVLELLDARTGSVRWSRPSPASLLTAFRELDGDLLAVTFEDARRLSVVDGREVWRIEVPGVDSYQPPVRTGGLLILPGRPIRALAPDTGRVVWTQAPPGSSLRIAGDADYLYVVTSRGIAVMKPEP